MSESVLGHTAVTADLVRWLTGKTRGNPLLLATLLEDLSLAIPAVIGAPVMVSDLLALDAGAASGVDRLVYAGLLVEDGTRAGSISGTGSCRRRCTR